MIFHSYVSLPKGKHCDPNVSISTKDPTVGFKVRHSMHGQASLNRWGVLVSLIDPYPIRRWSRYIQLQNTASLSMISVSHMSGSIDFTKNPSLQSCASPLEVFDAVIKALGQHKLVVVINNHTSCSSAEIQKDVQSHIWIVFFIYLTLTYTLYIFLRFVGNPDLRMTRLQ